jgi:hypothetical protein
MVKTLAPGRAWKFKTTYRCVVFQQGGCIGVSVFVDAVPLLWPAAWETRMTSVSAATDATGQQDGAEADEEHCVAARLRDRDVHDLARHPRLGLCQVAGVL